MNVTEYKGVTAERLLRIMEFGFTRSLGVNCTHCHVAGQWDSDDKGAKETARAMSRMVIAINNEYPQEDSDAEQLEPFGELHHVPSRTEASSARDARDSRDPSTMTLSAARVLVLSSSLLAVVPVAAGGRVPADRPAPVSATSFPMAIANDNRDAAGVLKDGVLTLRLVAEEARWRPEGQSDADPTRIIQAFAEEGKAPQIPGPLVRVPEGTDIRMSVRNTIPGAPMQPLRRDDASGQP